MARNAIASERGRAFCTPVNRGRKRRTGDGDDDNEGGFPASNIMGVMMVQQRSEQNSRNANRAAREAELALWQEEIEMRREESRLRFPAGILRIPVIPFFQAFGEEL